MSKEDILIDNNNNKISVLKNQKINLKSPKIISLIDDLDLLYGKMYFKNKLIHKKDGPAIEWSNGDKTWIKNGLQHRLDGPAIEYNDGGREYWILGEIKTEIEYNLYLRNKQIKSLQEDLTKELTKKENKKKMKV